MIFTQQENNLLCRLNGETLLLCPWGQSAIRVVAVPIGEPRLPDWALLPAQNAQGALVITETRAELTVGRLHAVVERGRWPDRMELAFYNQKGECLLHEQEPGGALKNMPRRFSPIRGGDYRLTASFEPDDAERFYGMGQYQQERLDLKGCSLELAHRNSQASVPFVLSSKGYGFLWHNPAVGRASFNANGTVWQAESTKQLDYWITAGDTPAEIEAAYADATGHVPMMPEYGLGFWQCKLRYWNQEQVLEVAREYKRRGLPLDVIVVDFFHWPKMGDFRFEEEFFPDPKAMAAELKAMGIELMVSVWPQIDLESENYREMKERGLLVKTEGGVDVQMCFAGNSVFFDATNPEARRFVWEKCRKNYYENGVRLFWLDEAEPEFGEYDYDNYRYYTGPVSQTGNIYPQCYSRTFYEGMTGQGQKDVVNLVRCAWAGSQRYGALVWSGDIHSDFETLRRQICAGLNMGMAGIPWWTTDIGGFAGGDPQDAGFRELLVRWFEWGTFCPVMRLHGDREQSFQPILRRDGTKSLYTGADNEVWSYGEDVCEILSAYIRLREKLRPYTRALMQQAHETGAPVMRTMFYEFPQDDTCWALKDQYMFGADLLVAPVLYAGVASREVYLPAGAAWTYLPDGTVYRGGQTVTVQAPLAVIPVFARDGRQLDWLDQ